MFDIHTHNIANREKGMLSGNPRQVSAWIEQWPEGTYSTGIHPWETAGMTPDDEQAMLQELTRVAAPPAVKAIGETGLDALRGADADTQERIFKAHIALSERLGKPLVLHVVKSYNRILEIRKEMARKLTQPWIMHGFRGKPQLAQALLASSTQSSHVYISLGEHFNPATAKAVPADRLLCETDDSPLSIEEITARIDAARAGACQAQ